MTPFDAGLLDDAPAGILAVSLGGKVLAHNRSLQLWLGVPPEAETGALIGRDITEWLSPASKLLYETRIMPRLLETGRMREIVIDIKTSEGRQQPFLLNAALGESANGDTIVRLALVYAKGRIAFEKELVEARHQSEVAGERLVLLQEATSRLAVAQGLDDLGETLVAAGARATQAGWTSVRLERTVGGGMASDVWTWGTTPAGTVHEGEFVAEQLVCRNLEELRARTPDAESLVAAGVEALVITPILGAPVHSPDHAEGVGPHAPPVVVGEISCWFRRPRTLDAEVLETLLALAAQAERVIDHLELQERIRHRALHDGLTGLANRVLLEEQLEQMLTLARRSGAPQAVLFLDLDGFKAINDKLGHAVGDEVLCTVADRLRVTCRSSEVVSRLGGDEFVVVASGLDEQGAAQLAGRIWEAIRAPLEGSAHGSPLSSSIGVIFWDPAETLATPTAEELLSAADTAMYEVKRSGKDAVFLRSWTPESPQT